MTQLLTALLMLMLVFQSFGQDKPVPDYLVQQHFPDSVRAVSLTTLEGKRVDLGAVLDAYQGKKIVVDIWASWCRDCLVGLPKLDALKKKTADDKVIYVFLSVDKDELKWKRAIERYNIQGSHYRIEPGWDSSLSSYIVLDWIPRYMVLNEEGRVMMPKAISASDEDLVAAVVKVTEPN